MKTRFSLNAAVAALAVTLALPLHAQKADRKSDTEKALDAAGKILGSLFGDDKNPGAAPVAPAAKAGRPAIPVKGPQVNAALARKQLRDDMDQKIAEFMQLHNDARAAVGVPPLQWDAKLAAYAQEWADKIATSGRMEHRPGGKYGENLAGYLPEYGERPVHGAKMWYDEIKDYRGEKMGNNNYLKVGHYTQMVWRKSTHVGFGIAMARDGTAMLCANYSPAGNMDGEHPYLLAGQAAPALPPAVANVGVPAPDAPVVGGIGVQFAKGWTNTRSGGATTSTSPDGTARVILTTVPGAPWDDIQGEMARHLAPLLPGLSHLTEKSTEHDVVRDGVGMRVVTYTARLNGRPANVVVDFARENNVDGGRVVLIIRCVEQGATVNGVAARKVVGSLRLKK